VELAAEVVASGIGLCKLCRVRFRLSVFDESAAGPDLLTSLASTDDSLALRGGNGVADRHTHHHHHHCILMRPEIRTGELAVCVLIESTCGQKPGWGLK